MKAFEFTIRASSGEYNRLDKEYSKYLINTMVNVSEEKYFRWEAYNLIMEQLINEGRYSEFDEAKYRLTDGENPNYVMLDIIERDKNEHGLIWLMRKRILEYIEEDFFAKFY
tara:strand:+ start:2177 stop:2512 length:336 start_codon:yes stop_codon:yes gene_type:complete